MANEKSFKLTKGVRLNVSMSGLGLSVGGKGLKFSVSPRGDYTSVGIPGTGLYKMSYLGKKGKPSSVPSYPISSNLPIPKELSPSVAVGILWTAVSLILLASYHIAGIISVT
jgi:hypothetical protein